MDLDLIEDHRRGDRMATELLIRRHLSRVRNLMYQMVLNNDVADDLSQDVFTRVLCGLESFQGRSSFETWLKRISLNVAYDFLRRSERRHRASDLEPDCLESGVDAPETRLIAIETRDRVASSLAKLPAKLRAAIVLTVMQEMTPSEAAEVEGCTVATIYWRIHEARRHLRSDLKEFFE